MKRIFIALLCIIFAVPLCIMGCSNDKNTIRLSEVTHSIFYAPLYIAINNGYFEEYDITIELSNGGGADDPTAEKVYSSAQVKIRDSSNIV